MTLGKQHGAEHPIQKCVGNVGVKQIGHTVHEVARRLAPAQRDLQPVLKQLHLGERSVGVCQISDSQRSAVGVLISAGWLGRRELPDQRTPAREEESSLDGERDVSFVAMSDSEILSQRIEGGTEA